MSKKRPFVSMKKICAEWRVAGSCLRTMRLRDSCLIIRFITFTVPATDVPLPGKPLCFPLVKVRTLFIS